ncbi:hypothetical protein, partial [Rhodopirellula bahusiensis]
MDRYPVRSDAPVVNAPVLNASAVDVRANDSPAQPIRSGGDALRIANVGFGLVSCLLMTICFESNASAQPPGTTPTPEIIRGDSGGIAPDAFLFLDESGTPVVMPRMS